MCATCQKKRAMDAAVTRADGLRQASSVIQWSDAHGAFQGFESISNREMSETGRTVPDMNEPLSRYDVTVTVAWTASPVPTLLDLLNSDAQPGFVDGTDANRRPRNNRLTRRSF